MRNTGLLLIFFLLPILAFSTTTGTGCKIGNGYIYTDYLGMASPYGPNETKLRYYNSNGNKIPFYWGYGDNDNRGYHCGFINVYGATSYYDSVLKKNVSIPAENEFSFLGGGNCIIAPTLGATPVAQDSYVSYTYNRTDKCAGSPQNVPIDDYIWLIVLATAGLGLFFLRNENIYYNRSL
ncbi:MAG: hypothetical protein V4541_07310 [Bacteroidota bacterium]